MPRQRLADQVYDQIMEAIHGGTISTTDRTVQEKLAEEFGISRTPVREALFRVEQESILEVAGRGSFKIATMSSDEVKEVYETRCAVEAFAARLLAQRNDNATCDKLREIIAQAEELENKATKAYFQANRTVHRSIVEASNNRFLLEFIDNLWNRGSSFALFATLEETSLEKSLGDHMALIQGPGLHRTAHPGYELGSGAQRCLDVGQTGHELQTGVTARNVRQRMARATNPIRRHRRRGAGLGPRQTEETQQGEGGSRPEGSRHPGILENRCVG